MLKELLESVKFYAYRCLEKEKVLKCDDMLCILPYFPKENGYGKIIEEKSGRVLFELDAQSWKELISIT
jgi:hypothetical protein